MFLSRLENPFTSSCCCAPRKTFAACKTLLAQDWDIQIFFVFISIFTRVPFSCKVSPSGKCCRGEYRLVVSTICVASQTGKEEQQGDQERDKSWRGKLFSLG